MLENASTPKSAALHRGPGFRIRRDFPRPKPEVIDALASYPCPDISDILNRLYTMKPELKNLTSDKKICGPACTVKVYPGDNLMVHQALDIAKSGDIVVVDAGESAMNGIVGDLISTKAKFRGIQGFVIDGLIRDLSDIQALDFPVYARGVTPVGPLHRGPGEINFSISCGGIVVNPGDVICGDENGLVVVRQEFAEELVSRLEEQKNSSAEYEENVKKGVFSNAWVNNALDSAGCVYVDE
ncbi:MAG: RraA family protein [Pseudomonadota bacterium]